MDLRHKLYERIKGMEIIKLAQVGLFLFTITSSGFALANCPGSMPEQLLEDCIVYEGAGANFPTSDYAHMDQYQDWLKTQQPLAITQPTTATTPLAK
jgi:hypothetical protein